MDSDQYARAATHVGLSSCRLLIAVPFFENEHLVGPLIDSLIRCADDLAATAAEVVLYNDSPAYPVLQPALEAAAARARQAFCCKVVCNSDNLGFVGTMNLAVNDAVARRCDLLILNSDTQAEPGAFAEMARVLRLDHMTGFVNPRSNNATIATLPLDDVPEGYAASLAAYRSLAAKLAPVSYVPTSVGFCLLIRWRVLAEFGGFDPIYGKGYNEENDLVMRASRCGFRAVLSNHAFVWHLGEESFSKAPLDRFKLEPVNRAVLDARYPEYSAYIQSYFDSPEVLAERLLAKLQPDRTGRLDLAFDFSSFRAAHNGTYLAGRHLLAAAPKVWGDRFRLHVICEQDVYQFHDYAALGIPRVEPHAGMRFAAVFRVGQPYDWNAVERLMVSGAVVGVFMLDTISIDCPQLTSPLLYNIWQFTLEHIDLLAAQSHQTQAHFRARFTIPGSVTQVVSLHSLDLADYVLPVPTMTISSRKNAAARILVLGNQFHHKFVAQTANALAARFPDRHIVALGQGGGRFSGDIDYPPPPELDTRPNLTGIPVGGLADTDMGLQYAACDVVVFPSHAEGFGFPVLNALASKRPVMVRRLPVFEEIWRALHETPNIHFYESTQELLLLLRELPQWVETGVPARNGIERTAREIKAALDSSLAQADYHRIVGRIRAIQLTAALAGYPPKPSGDVAPALVARFVVERSEAVLHRLLTIKFVYVSSRLLFRSARRFRRFLTR